MAYYTGSAANFTALRAALIDACVDNGWTWDAGNEELSKSAIKIRLTTDSLHLTARARLTSGTDTGASGKCHIGRSGATGNTDLVFPVVYRVFAFAEPDEVYLVVSHSVDVYQFMAFGKSAIALPGSGTWLSASLDNNAWYDTFNFSSAVDGSTGTSGSSSRCCPVMFASNGFSDTGHRNSYLHHKLESGLDDWMLGAGNASGVLAEPGWCTKLATQPNVWNSESVLLPLRAWLPRASNKISLAVDLKNARHVRIDYYDHGQILTLGEDHWMVFPWYRKNVAARNGGSSILHSGTAGWAIRYDGP